MHLVDPNTGRSGCFPVPPEKSAQRGNRTVEKVISSILIMEIKRPNTPQDGPADGVMGVVECIRTDFLENPAEGEAAFQQRDKSQAHITASVEIGTFGIRDMATGVMLTVSLEDAMEIMKEAIDASKKE